MKNAKKIVALLLVVALTAAVAVGGTLAYLTKDAGSETNVFSVGNVDIKLEENVGVQGAGSVTRDEDDDNTDKDGGASYEGLMPGDKLQKEVTVCNKGANDAYVAVTVTLKNDEHTAANLINSAIDKFYEAQGYSAAEVQAVYNYIFNGWGINYNPRPGALGVDDARGVIDGTYGLPEHVLHVDFAKTSGGSTLIGAGNWFVAGSEKAGQYWVDGPKAYDGYYTANMADYEICYTYYLYLPAGECSTLFSGLNIPAEFNADQLAMFDGLQIVAEAKAIQADNITVDKLYADDAVYGKAKTAFAILAGDIEGEGIYSDITPENGSLSLENGAVVKLTGEQEALSISGNGTVVLEDVSVTASDGSALTIASGAKVNVSVVGKTSLTGTNGIEVEENAVLNLVGSGSLNASGTNGNGIGGAGTINISGLSSLNANGSGDHAFGIGGESKNITITNTTIENVSGGHVGEVGTDSSFYKDAPEGGCAIGSSTNGAVITLNNVKISNAQGGSKAAGIGASYWTTVTVNITNCTIDSVTGGATAAGIGGSRIMRDGHNTTTINITDSTINAQGGVYGAGIGSGYDTYCHTGDMAPVCTIHITGKSNITAVGGQYAAGIGTGYHAGGLTGEIAGTVTVNATSGEKVYKDTYTTAMDVGFGVLDPARDGSNNSSTFNYQGEVITVPTV